MYYILITYSLFLTLILIFISRDITFFGRAIFPEYKQKKGFTDQEKMILATDELKLFYWPSKIHLIDNARAQLREVWVFLINIISKLFKSKDEFINVFLSLISNFGCIVLIYQILNIYFSTTVAFFGAALYSTSIWPYQIAFYFGHILLSQFFFFLSIFILALMDLYPELSYLLLFLSGFLLIICFSSSSASRKYPPIILLFLIFQLFEEFEFIFDQQRSVLLFLLLILNFFLFQILKGKIYEVLEKKIKNNISHNKNLDKYVKKSKKGVANIVYVIIPVILIFLSYNGNFNINWKIFVFSSGTILALYIILSPQFFRNFARYVVYLNIGSWANHFYSYPKNFFKVDTSGDFRAPMSWYIFFLFRFCPLIFLIYIFSFFFLIFMDFFTIKEKIIYIVLSLIPFFIIEFSKAIRVAKSYLPILIGMIFLIVVVISKLENILSNNIFFWILNFLILLNVLHKIFFLITDILPTRLGPSRLAKFLIKNKIYEVGTYDNAYNEELVGPIIQKFPNKIKFNFYNSINDCKNCDYFLIPQRSAKSVTMETQQFAIKNGDFKLDQKLNEIEKKGILEKITLKKFKMLGTSRFFVGESEISGFREFCLKDISDSDRKLSYALILNLRELKEY